MKYAKDTRPHGVTDKEAAQILAEALPWIKNITGKTILVKYGGAAMTDKKLRADVMSDIVLLKIVGANPVIVHGGGKDISRAMDQAGLPVEFIDGQRVTTDEGMDVVRTVLAGKVNQQLVRALNEHGNFGIGVNGIDGGTIIAEPASGELGRVGNIKRINAELLKDLIAADYIPVIASVAIGNDGGYCNVNADLVASEIAVALGATKILFLTDVDGLYEDFSDKSSLISNLTMEECQAMLDRGEIDTGMIPKLNACIEAVKAGVFRAHIINGTTPHSLLLELLTDAGVGTVLHSSETAYEYDTHPHPLSTFAARLFENLDEVSKLQALS